MDSWMGTNELVLPWNVQIDEQWLGNLVRLEGIIDKYKEHIEPALIGFPENWKDILNRTS